MTSLPFITEVSSPNPTSLLQKSTEMLVISDSRSSESTDSRSSESTDSSSSEIKRMTSLPFITEVSSPKSIKMPILMTIDSHSSQSTDSNSSHLKKMTPVPFTTEIFNPRTPVEVPVRGFTYGQRLRVVLQPIDKKDKKFHINLKSGEDIVVHFNPRMKEKSLVFNSYYHGGWQTEERASVVFPFEAKEIYTVEFVATGHNSVTVHVNGHHLYEFRERQSGWAVSSIEVGGDVHVHSVHIG